MQAGQSAQRATKLPCELAKALLTYETLSGEEIKDLINKNIYPAGKEDLKVEDNNKDSALGSLGLKPKIVH